MAKYRVRCFYTYCGSVEVEADSIEEARNKGHELCSEMTTDELEYIGYTDTEVEGEDDDIYQFA